MMIEASYDVSPRESEIPDTFPSNPKDKFGKRNHGHNRDKPKPQI
jgi:hypothetical protein